MGVTPSEIYDDMQTRCSQVWTFARENHDDAAQAAMGALVRTDDDGYMAVEVGQANGTAFVSARLFNGDGDPVPMTVLQTDESVLITGA